ncbi:hypothetical protein PDE_06051 [Penicillium oxalicum 114-2]|uniref:FAD-binding PCMH-type domain-containing protein n=1 Tax=Penicillium oxalicum (strain 114-2 / CGMCC 5302) TaxID=933388 RepID=S7ZR06_PENO1|nr:hypothetical protein PDE_06051 [Penicillium oxalicum 114-2]
MNLKGKLKILDKVLSEGASIKFPGDPDFYPNTIRWSEYAAPQPGAVINVATETDVQKTLAVNLKEGWAIIEAGALVGEVIDAAYAAKAHVVVGNCNSVGACGAMLGGGFSRLQANYSISIDNVISLRLVTEKGDMIAASSTENVELLWGLKGAGHNFGIVTAAKVKAFPQINNGIHWESTMVFLPDHIEEVTQTINDLHMGEGMSIHYVFTGLSPFGFPAVVLELWYAGTPSDAQKAFAPLFSLKPIYQDSSPTPYNEINAVLDRGQYKGGQKPMWSVALEKIDPAAARELWKHYLAFRLRHPSAKDSVVMFQCYGFGKVRQVPDESAAFPWRALNFHVCASLLYSDPILDEAANVWGDKFRQILQEASGMRKNKVYVNYATGNEPIEEKYGYGEDRLKKLRDLKTEWDPEGRFSHYHPIH